MITRITVEIGDEFPKKMKNGHQELLRKIQNLFQPQEFSEGQIEKYRPDEAILQMARKYLASRGPLMPEGMGVTRALTELQDVDIHHLQDDLNQSFLDHLEIILDQAVKVHRPEFIGHMTSALPYYVPSLMYLIGSLNQNIVKIETSGGLSALEKNVIMMLHRQIYSLEQTYYTQVLQDGRRALGAFCSGGTVGNLTALWALRRHFCSPQLSPNPQNQEHKNFDMLRVYVSQLGHYSIRKSIDVLGFSPEQMVVLPSAYFTTEPEKLELRIENDIELGCVPFVIIGIAGSTETGSVDDLEALAGIARKYKCYFHVDAAWGGAFVVAGACSQVFKGIEHADSIVIDAHKQLYVPIGCGLVLFKNESFSQAIQFKANYIIREGSYDLGQCTLEGSRSALSLILYAHLRIIGLSGFRILFESLLEVVDTFAFMIKQSADFQLTTQPTLNILTYRFRPAAIATGTHLSLPQQELLDQMTVAIHKKQRATGEFFVSRTRLLVSSEDGCGDVFRVVIANPNTRIEHCLSALHEQRLLVQNDPELQALEQQCINNNETK